MKYINPNMIFEEIKNEKLISRKLEILERNINNISLIEKIENGELKLGIQAKVLNKKFGIKVWSYQKTNIFNNRFFNNNAGYEYYVEEKYSGVRVFVIVEHNGNLLFKDKKNNAREIPKLKKELLTLLNNNLGSFVFDGIINNGIYYIFDIVPFIDFKNGNCRIPLWNRKKIISSIIREGEKVKYFPTKLISKEEIEENILKYKNNILKERLSHYDCYSSNWSLIK